MARERKSEEEEIKMRSLKAKLGKLKTGGKPKSPLSKTMPCTTQNVPRGHDIHNAATSY